MKKSFLSLLLQVFLVTFIVSAQKETQQTVNQLVVIANNPGPIISKNIYGHFSEHLGRCIYEGLWVGPGSKIPNTYGIRNDVIAALREMKIPNLRWPGGCFADTYHWKDGIGPQEKRASIVNVHWGGVTEDNSFGTHEFMKLTELLGCDAYINGNLGSGTVRELSEWIEYLTSDADSPMTRLRKENGREQPWKVKMFAIGNENWGCGGNMTADFYADQMRQYSTYLRSYAGNQLYRVACGPSNFDVAWTETLMKDSANSSMFQGISCHYYSLVDGWNHKRSATNFTEAEWIRTFRANLLMDKVIKGHAAIMDRYDPEKTKGLIVDEWGNWFDVEPGTNPGFLYQQNTLRDAITAAIHFNIFNSYADRVKGANIAQLANVLQSVILTKEAKMVLTPTYYAFKMYNVFQDARLIPTSLKCEDYSFDGITVPAISASASVDTEGKLHISIANLNPNKSINLSCPIIGDSFKKVTGQVLTSGRMNDFNDFDKDEIVKPVNFTGFNYKDGTLTVMMPSKSVVVLELTK